MVGMARVLSTRTVTLTVLKPDQKQEDFEGHYVLSSDCYVCRDERAARETLREMAKDLSPGETCDVLELPAGRLWRIGET